MSDQETLLADLAATAAVLQQAEHRVSELRDRRNHLIHQVCGAGVTERCVARVAEVSPAYVHRVRQFEGQPPSGPHLDRKTRNAR